MSKVRGETITSGVYAAQILWGPLSRYARQALKEGVNIRVVEDGASLHSHGDIPRIRTMLPIVTPSSLHLNPIERYWQLVTEKVRAMDRHATSVDGLWGNIQRIWEEIPQETIEGFIMDMYERRRQVTEG
jgi:hypothetical protein